MRQKREVERMNYGGGDSESERLPLTRKKE